MTADSVEVLKVEHPGDPSGRERNAKCPCGSGKKWKRCHADRASSLAQEAYAKEKRDSTLEELVDLLDLPPDAAIIAPGSALETSQQAPCLPADSSNDK